MVHNKKKTEEASKHPKGAHIIYLSIVGIIFFAMAIVFIFFPRPSYSELEKRDLAEFPDIASYEASNISKLPSDISFWFSDSEPFRDKFMGLSMNIRDVIRLKRSNPEDQISFKPSEDTEMDPGAELVADEELVAAGNPMADANAKIATKGTIVIGSGENVRGLTSFGGTPQMGNSFVKMAKAYADQLPGVQIFALIPPTAAEFYLPEKGKSLSKPQKPVIDYIRENLPSSVKFVDAYSYLAAHTNEDIYLRTDHHWAPLGAFYGAKAFAKVAGVPFKELDSYNEHVIHRFVGSMYGFTKDIAIKNAPEDFYYYTPKGLDYVTTYITYKTNKAYSVTGESKPTKGEFFHKFGDGSGNAYLTFMGGDQKLVKVETGVPSRRKLLIIKDSYGNPVPGYLFYSFSEVHVADFRYFPNNMKKYIADNGITDLLFVFGIFNAVGTTPTDRTTKLLNQAGGFDPEMPKTAAAPADQEAKKETAPVPTQVPGAALESEESPQSEE